MGTKFKHEEGEIEALNSQRENKTNARIFKIVKDKSPVQIKYKAKLFK